MPKEGASLATPATLWATATVAPVLPDSPTSPEAVPNAKCFSRLRVLAVEDESADVELITLALRSGGFEARIDVASSADQFAKHIQGNVYDVVLADYNLPSWNGMDTIEILRREEIDIPVIVVSGSLGELKAVECIKKGAADYVLKDHLPRLPEAVRRAIRERKLREAHRRSQEELARSNRDLEQFAYVASHDLQEPLRMVATYTQLLAERYHGKLDENADKYIHYAVDGALRMQTLVQDLLAFSRVGRQGRDLKSIDSNTVIEIVKKNLESAIRETGARIEYEQLPAVFADQSQLIQVFQNLIANAIKFRGGKTPVIRIAVEKKSAECVFSVSDNGIGIPSEHAEIIFVIFKRLHTHQEYPGSGIGLAICKKIVEQHGGQIWLETHSGSGTVFKFTLPDRGKREAYSQTDEIRL